MKVSRLHPENNTISAEPIAYVSPSKIYDRNKMSLKAGKEDLFGLEPNFENNLIPMVKDFDDESPLKMKKVQIDEENKSEQYSSVSSEDEEVRLPNKLDKFSFGTKCGSNIHKKEEKKNQDTFMSKLDMIEKDFIHLFAVADGHGSSGQEIAQFVEKEFHPQLEESLVDYLIAGRSAGARGKLDYNQPDTTDIKAAIKEAFAKIEEKLSWLTIDIKYSGSTLTGVLLFGEKLYVFNLGDSRTILVR